MLTHDLVQECKAVHSRHLNIEGYYVGRFMQYSFCCDEGVRGRAHDLDLRIRRKYLGKGLPHDSRVVDNKDPYLPAHDRYRQVALFKRFRYTSPVWEKNISLRPKLSPTSAAMTPSFSRPRVSSVTFMFWLPI